MKLLCVVAVTNRDVLELPSRLWSEGLYLGDRLQVRASSGEVQYAVVTAGVNDAPTLRLDCGLDADASRAYIRRAVSP